MLCNSLTNFMINCFKNMINSMTCILSMHHRILRHMHHRLLEHLKLLSKWFIWNKMYFSSNNSWNLIISIYNEMLVYYTWNHFIHLMVYFFFSHFFQSGTILFLLFKLLLLLYLRKIRKKELDDMAKIYSICNLFYNTWIFYLLFLYFIM